MDPGQEGTKLFPGDRNGKALLQITLREMEQESPLIRPMNLADMPSLMRLKNAEGWNQTEEDWGMFLGYDASVNLVAVIGQKIVASVTAINYANDVVWIGMMLVDRNYRGRGISKLLLTQVLEQMQFCKSIKLDATPAGHPVYRKFGFMDELRISRNTHPSVAGIPGVSHSFKVEAINSQVISEIFEYDQSVFGARREKLLNGLFQQAPELGWYIRDAGGICGYSLGRKGSRFIQLGPVSASSGEGALALIRVALGQIKGKACVIDLHTDKTEVAQWLLQAGFSAQREFIRMYLESNPLPGRISRQFLICGPEFG